MLEFGSCVDQLAAAFALSLSFFVFPEDAFLLCGWSPRSPMACGTSGLGGKPSQEAPEEVCCFFFWPMSL